MVEHLLVHVRKSHPSLEAATVTVMEVSGTVRTDRLQGIRGQEIREAKEGALFTLYSRGMLVCSHSYSNGCRCLGAVPS